MTPLEKMKERDALKKERDALKKERDLYKGVVIAAIGRILSMPPVTSGPLFEVLKAMREAVK